MELTGTVSSGLGRAHVFMAQPHYQEQFRTVLGSKAWPGTLNMEIDKAMLYLSGCDVVMLHCNSSYPANLEDLNLSCIKTLKKRS